MGGYKGYTPAQGKAHTNYISKHARIEIRTDTDTREAIQSKAQAAGQSVNVYILQAVRERMEQEGGRDDEQ